MLDEMVRPVVLKCGTGPLATCVFCVCAKVFSVSTCAIIPACAIGYMIGYIISETKNDLLGGGPLMDYALHAGGLRSITLGSILVP